MTTERDLLERAIDQAARQMTAIDPSPDFVARVLGRIEQSDHGSGAQKPFSPLWQLAAGGLALAIVLLLLLSRQAFRQSIPVEAPNVTRTADISKSRPASSAPRIEVPAAIAASVAPVRASRRPGQRERASAPFPAVSPIEIPSINLDPIEMAEIEVARFEISPIRIDPVRISRQETP
jgi:hypothetical protein